MAEMDKFDYIKERLETHINTDDKRFTDINENLRLIKENHLAHIERSLNAIENSHIALKTNTEWLLKFFWIIAGGTIGSLLTSLYNIFIK